MASIIVDTKNLKMHVANGNPCKNKYYTYSLDWQAFYTDDYLNVWGEIMPVSKTPKKKNITIYRTQTCPYCHMAEEFFNQNKIKYKSIDVGKNPKAAQEMIKKSGQMGVPVIDINGKIIVGFDKAAFRKALGIK